MKEIKIINRFKLAMKRANNGIMTHQDLKAIVEFQLRNYVNEEDKPFNDEELAILAHRMMIFN
jgi:hypothetical protein